MARRKKPLPLYTKVEVLDAGAEGKSVARISDKVIFVPFVVPGDIIDIQATRKKKSYLEGIVTKIHHYSDKRIDAKCEHFGLCGGCKWQNMDYKHQLFYKQKQVEDSFVRIGKIKIDGITPILPSGDVYYYRNKLEYTFSNKKWFVNKEEIPQEKKMLLGLGFHLPGHFDKILDINKCWLQNEPSNEIRLAIKDFAIKNNLSFYNVRSWDGLLRNLIIRNTSTGEVMLIVVFQKDDKENIKALLDFVANRFSGITSLHYIINSKKNDDVSDQEVHHYKGKPYLTEVLGLENGKKLKFKIGPLSFFQTNTKQAEKLYKVAKEFAGLSVDEIVYDLYTGTGTIANYVADNAKKVVGIEFVPSSIEDAKENSEINNITNTVFFAGDIVKVMDDDFIEKHGKPEVIITDPPRAGMHATVVEQILKMQPEKIVYISCNPATQARDINLMLDHYSVDKIQPVDMFPHTGHVENVVLLKRI